MHTALTSSRTTWKDGPKSCPTFCTDSYLSLVQSRSGFRSKSWHGNQLLWTWTLTSQTSGFTFTTSPSSRAPSPSHALELPEQPSRHPSVQDSDSKEHNPSTQVVLHPETPARAVPTPLIALSSDFTPVPDLITRANADVPTDVSTGLPDLTQGLPTQGSARHRSHLHLAPEKLSELQAKLGTFTHEWSSHTDKSSLQTVPGLLNFVKTQGNKFAHILVIGHRPRFRETLRALNKLLRENPSSLIQFTFVIPYSPNAKWWSHLPGKHTDTLWSVETKGLPTAVFSTVDQFAPGPPPKPTPVINNPAPPEVRDINEITLPDLSNVLITY